MKKDEDKSKGNRNEYALTLSILGSVGERYEDPRFLSF